jgi:single-strand DNA-binding protein
MTLLNDALATPEPTKPTEPTKPSPVNQVHLVGRLSKPPIIKEMPSGDLLGTWRLVVARPEQAASADTAEDGSDPAAKDVGAGRRRQTVDTIDCVSFDLDLIGRMCDVEAGSLLELHGALRRRFSRRLPGGQSRYEVEAFAAVVLTPMSPPETGDPDATERSRAAEADLHAPGVVDPAVCGSPERVTEVG